MKILVIGGTGLIGSKTVAILRQPEWRKWSAVRCAGIRGSQGVAPSAPHHSSVNEPGNDSKNSSSA
jgi:hypothetical protein